MGMSLQIRKGIRIKIIKYKIYTIIILISCMLILFPSAGRSQENSGVSTKNRELSSTEKSKSQHSLYSGLGFGNNMIYMGSNVGQDKPFYAGSLAYGYKNELFATVSVSHLSAFEKAVAFSSYSIGYNHDFNSWFDISPGLSRYQVNSQLTDTLFSSFLYSYLTLGFDWKILYTTVTAGGLFSEANSAYLNLKNSRFFKTPEFLSGKAYFYFDPYVNMLFGTLTKTVTSEGTIIGVSEPFNPKKSSGGGTNGGGTVSTGTTSNYFSLMEFDFGLPVGFSAGKFTIEAEPGYVLPAYSGSDIQSPEGFTLIMSIYYRIF